MVRIIFAILLMLFTAPRAHAEENNFSEWREWISAQQSYLNKIESLMDMSKKLAIRQNAELQAAINKNDTESGDKLLTDTTKQLSAIIDLLKALEPPLEFKDYHEKVIEAYGARLKANEAAIQKDVINVRDRSRSAMMSEVEAMESLRRLYLSHKAPPQVIDSIDKNIEAYKKRLITN